VEYLEELAQWFYYHEMALQDSVDLLHWAVDVVLSLDIERPPWLEAPNTDGRRFVHFVWLGGLVVSALGMRIR